jgi:hypothetical protein
LRAKRSNPRFDDAEAFDNWSISLRWIASLCSQ